MAHKKAGGSVKNGRDSVGQRLGVKASDGQTVTAGIDHRPPARDDVLLGPGHRARQGLHRVRDARWHRQVRAQHQEQEAHPGRGGRDRFDDRLAIRAGETGYSRRSPAGRWPCTEDVGGESTREAGYPSQVLRSEGPLRLMRSRVDGRVDPTRAARRRVQQLPPVLHGHPERSSTRPARSSGSRSAWSGRSAASRATTT